MYNKDIMRVQNLNFNVLEVKARSPKVTNLEYF